MATQSIQILDSYPSSSAPFSRWKGKRGYFLTAIAAFTEAYKRAVADFLLTRILVDLSSHFAGASRIARRDPVPVGQ